MVYYSRLGSTSTKCFGMETLQVGCRQKTICTRNWRKMVRVASASVFRPNSIRYYRPYALPIFRHYKMDSKKALDRRESFDTECLKKGANGDESIPSSIRYRTYSEKNRYW